MPLICGIDPGLTGAIAAITMEGQLVSLQDTPVISVKKGKSTKNQYQPSQMFAILNVLWQCTEAKGTISYPPPTAVRIVAIENVHAMPQGKSGSQAGFSLGYSLGLWTMGCTALKFPLEMVEPAVWKRAMGCKGADKGLSRQIALRLFPGAAGQLARGKDEGRAEALLIAEFLRRKLTGQTFPALK
jgi:hypothetical protein